MATGTTIKNEKTGVCLRRFLNVWSQLQFLDTVRSEVHEFIGHDDFAEIGMVHSFQKFLFEEFFVLDNVRERSDFSAGDSQSVQFRHKPFGRVVVKNVFHRFDQMILGLHP